MSRPAAHGTRSGCVPLVEFTTILLYSALPTLGAIVGTALAERVRISERRLSLALHGAAGVVVGVVALELMPRTLAITSTIVVGIAFVVGGLLFVAVDRATHLVPAMLDPEASGAGGPWALAFGIGMDLVTDGILVGAGGAVSAELGLLAGVGLMAATLPEGFATAAAFKRQGVRRPVRIATLVGLALTIPVGAAVGFLWLRDRPAWWAAVVLAFTAGVLMTLLVEEMSPQAHREGGERLAALVFLAGFAVFAIIHALLG